MVLCSVDDVKAYFTSATLSDADYLAIITTVSAEVLTKAGATAESNALLIQAGIHGSVAVAMKRARSSGELAGSVKQGNYQIQNTGLIEEINMHEKEKEAYIQQYKDSIRRVNLSIPFGRIGYGTVNAVLK
ncbi:MAG: hypothetical protein ACOYIG_10960 [Acetivibrionales bacterium]|jgi:hypothetical protein